MLRLTRLTLTEFRNYPALTWRPGARISVVTGPNGSGKTNLLEAISLLVPGRGLRTARIGEFGRDGAAWGVVGRVERDGIESEIATGTPPDGPLDRRIFRLDGASVRNQADIAAAAAAIWLTPQMDRLFGEAASGRRRFLDRLVWALEPGHAREVAAYDTANSSRSRLLAAGGADPAWLAGLEDSMARHAIAVTAARATLVSRLNATMAAGVTRRFPPARIGLEDTIADRLTIEPALAVEDWLREALAGSRQSDAGGSARWGAHRADMVLIDRESGLAAGLASTGQQKALLIGVLLGHAALITAARGFFPAPAARRARRPPRLRAPRRAVGSPCGRPGAGHPDRHRHRRLHRAGGSRRLSAHRRGNIAVSRPIAPRQPCLSGLTAPILAALP